ncbi:hypothetical protein MKX03_017216 [Papaver bracteatum]|nr:hypothetical protein MKX03_017216 [Papaver bracteatum]
MKGGTVIFVFILHSRKLLTSFCNASNSEFPHHKSHYIFFIRTEEKKNQISTRKRIQQLGNLIIGKTVLSHSRLGITIARRVWTHNWYLGVLEANPNGKILKYNPFNKKTTALIDSLCFPNGVALSRNQHFLVFCETWRFRCLIYCLEGKNKGKLQVFIDNHPGGPDNINLAPDGSFWIPLLPVRFEFIHKWPMFKYVVAQYPKLVELLRTVNYKRSMVVNVAADRKNVIRKFDDEGAKVMPFLASPLEFEGHLYLGSLGNNFMGKLKLHN